MTLEALLAPPEPSPELIRAFAEVDWPEELLRRAVATRMASEGFDYFLKNGKLKDLAVSVEEREAMIFGPLRLREASTDDFDQLVELYANSPEEIGDWEVTVERGPYPYAQFRLQENVMIQVLENQGVLVAAIARSCRNSIVDGERITVQITEAARVRREARGQGYSNFVRRRGPMGDWYRNSLYVYVRDQNANAVNWIMATGGASAQTKPADGESPGLTATVDCYLASAGDSDARGIRKVRRGDARHCCSLINSTHRGLDLFRPYSVEFLHRRLDDPAWGPKPDWWTPVYGWEDYYVIEEDSRIIACAGLWDRGRHVREVWRDTKTGEQKTLEFTALLDFGWARGREDAMARLARYLLGVTADLGRSRLMAPLEHWPALQERLADIPSIQDRRGIVWWDFVGRRDGRKLRLQRPDTDLAYW